MTGPSPDAPGPEATAPTPTNDCETTELRVYTLSSAAAVREYTSEFWPRHVVSLNKYGITVHGVWTDADEARHRVIALVGYRPGADPADLAATYRASADFVDDHRRFDMSQVGPPEVTVLAPTPWSAEPSRSATPGTDS